MSEATRTGASHGNGAITPSDTADLPKVDGRYPRAIRVNGAGNIVIQAPDGTAGVWTVAGPETLGMQAKRILATGTTVSGPILPIY